MSVYFNPSASAAERSQSIVNNSQSIESLCPVVSTDLFTGNDLRFWLGRVASMGLVEKKEEYISSGILRANVYIDEMHFLPPEKRLSDGTERDQDDERSWHFAAIEHTPEGLRARGVARLIMKESIEHPLPVERLFPEVFDENPAPEGATEISRFIARHSNRRIQAGISLALMRSITEVGHNNESPVTYAVVEEKFARRLRLMGLPFDRVTDAKYLEEYNTPNLAIRLNAEQVIERVKNDIGSETLGITPYFSSIIDKIDGGSDYYNETFLKS